jgi:hypothetical protein
MTISQHEHSGAGRAGHTGSRGRGRSKKSTGGDPDGCVARMLAQASFSPQQALPSRGDRITKRFDISHRDTRKIATRVLERRLERQRWGASARGPRLAAKHVRREDVPRYRGAHDAIEVAVAAPRAA